MAARIRALDACSKNLAREQLWKNGFTIVRKLVPTPLVSSLQEGVAANLQTTGPRAQVIIQTSSSCPSTRLSSCLKIVAFRAHVMFGFSSS